MIASLSGTVLDISGNIVVLDVGGVGYEVICSSGCLKAARAGSELKIITHTDVKEDHIRLYGFEDQLEKRVFGLLVRVKGLGAKSASELLSKIDKRELLRVIGDGDLDRLLAIKGIGRKTAERILVELRDKVMEHAAEMHAAGPAIEKQSKEPFREAVEALRALGFGEREAERAVQLAGEQLTGERPDSSEVVKQALRFV